MKERDYESSLIKKTRYRPVNKSADILKMAQSLEKHMYGSEKERLESIEKNGNDDNVTKILMDQPIQKKHKVTKISKFNL